MAPSRRHLLLLLFWLFAAPWGAAAQKYVLRLQPAWGSDVDQLRRDIAQVPTRFSTKKRLQQTVWSLLPELQQKGWLTAAYDTLYTTGDMLTAVLQLDLKYRWVSVSLNRLDTEVLQKAGVQPAAWNTRPLDKEEFINLTRRLLRTARKLGYGLPRWRWERPLILPDGGVSGTLWLTPVSF